MSRPFVRHSQRQKLLLVAMFDRWVFKRRKFYL